MRWSSAVLLAFLGHLALTGAWDVNFKRSECYKYGLDNLEDRMPVTLGNLVSLLEKMEGDHIYMNPDAIAEALVHRYQIHGITYDYQRNTWSPIDDYEVDKADILKTLVTMDQTVSEFTFEPREECALHFMLSHSVDMYPHAGLDYVWENSRVRRRRDVEQQGRLNLPQNTLPATHPIENGVIWTPSGPVAAGTLLTGLMIIDNSQGLTLSQMYSAGALEFMPDEMTQKRVMPLHAATLAGDIGQSALIGYGAQTSTNDQYLGPNGMFANSTAAPKLFTLERKNERNIPYLTRAEAFAGIDSLLIQKVLRESNNNQLSLSKALKMYYSNYGLPGYPDYRACNRMQAFKSLDLELIKEQTLHYMYAYSEKIPSVRDRMQQYKHDFPSIENSFKLGLSKAWNEFSSFVDGYDYSEYDRCPMQTTNTPLCENKVDLLVVYGYEGGEIETQKERDYIAHLGQMLDVGVDRSRIGVMDGKSAQWIYPMTNLSNVADWGSNFSESTTYYGSGSDMTAVLVGLNSYYYQFYNHMRSNANNASANAQVVLWNVPNSVPNQEVFKQLMEDFRLNYPDVYFLFVGKSRGSFTNIMLNPTEDFFTNIGQDAVTFAKTLAARICEIPTVFTYPACDPNNANFTNIAESSHIYTGYVSPNYTTYIKISPYYFRFSEKVIIESTDGDVSVCGSRTSMNVDSNTQERICNDNNNNLEWWFLCGRWINECDPIYLAVSGSSSRVNTFCQEPECSYPNQIKFQIKHDGMTCGAWFAPPSLLLMAVAALTLLLQPRL